MAGKTPTEAYLPFRDPMAEALGCIAHGRLSVPHTHRFEADRVYPIVLNNGDPVVLRGVDRILFTAGQNFRLVATDDKDRGPFKVQTVQYVYAFEIVAGRKHELLAFHWTPEETRPGARTYPHLHVGSAMIASDAPFLPDRFNKLHIPTSRVSLESVVRFAIEELRVPGKRGWEDILGRTHAAFETWRTRTA